MDPFEEEVAGIRSVQQNLSDRLLRLNKRIEVLENATTQRRTAPPAEPVAEEPPPLPRAVPKTPDHPPQRETPASPPPTEQRVPRTPANSFELRFGQVWLVRIGIVVLLTGLVFLGNYAWHEIIGRIGAFGKLTLLTLAAGGLIGAGWRLQRHASLRNYARVLLGGGLATIYYATFAAHFIPTLRVIESPLVGGALLLALGGTFVWLADRIRSNALAITTIALTFYTAAINPLGQFSLFSNLVVSLAGVALLIRHQWTATSFLTLVGSYVSFAFWRFHNAGSLAVVSPEAFVPALLFPVAYWLVHTAAVLWNRTPTFEPAARPFYLTTNNAAMFALIAPVIESQHPGTLWVAALAFGAILIGLALVAARTNRSEPAVDGSYLTQGLALLFASLVFKLAGWTEPVTFALFAGTLIALSRIRHGVILRIFAAIAALIATLSAAEGVVESAARVPAFACAAILIANGVLLRLRKGLQTQSGVDLETCWYVLLATVLTILASLSGGAVDIGLRLLVIGTVAALSARLLRLPEVVYAGQGIVGVGQSFLVASAAVSREFEPVWSLGAAAILIAWWQRRTSITPLTARLWQSIHCFGPALIGFLFIRFHFQDGWFSTVVMAAALIAVVIGFATRTWPVAFAAGFYTVAALGALAGQIASEAAWTPSLVTISLLPVQAFAITALGFRAPVTASGMLLGVCRALRAISTTLAVWMLFVYSPSEAWLLALAGVGSLALIFAVFTSYREAAIHGAALLGIGIAAWLVGNATEPARGIDLAGFAALIATQRIIRMRGERLEWLPAWSNPALIFASSGGLWILTHRLLLSTNQSSLFITIAWSLLAFALLGAGFVWRERSYRHAGLVILVASIVRVFVIDVWSLETILRIVSFLVLGVVLLVLSFLYNKHAEALRKWL